MHDPIHEHQWDVRAAYRKGWEERMDYYDRFLHGVMELIEGAVIVELLRSVLHDVGYEVATADAHHAPTPRPTMV
jgi:hypothetical protein